MGRVTTRIRVENWLDAELLAIGARKEKPRTIETDALVDTGAVKFYLRSSVIQQLGLRPIGEIKSRTMSARSETRRVFAPVSLEIRGRTGRYDAVEVPDSVPNVVGRPQADAQTRLAAVGLLSAINTAHSANVKAGRVISQSPVGGARAAKGSTVTLLVSVGP